MDKNQILKEFSADPDRYYKVKLFEEQGFIRKSCTKCNRFFWTLDPSRTLCPDDGVDTYSFIGEPPTTKRFDYTQAWKKVEEFFVKNNHTSVSRYPVVCRWRDDLYFTIASIVDFQRVMGSKVVFEFPANPLVVPQICLRFKDLENVGVTGRHFSSFCMIGQHSIPDNGGYWKDECVDLDFKLLTQQFGIKKEEVVFVEDVWAGGGSFGSSLEYFVRGLELGNAVFTEFQGELGEHTTLDQKIIDMGAGLERFAWITTGTPTAYDCCFGPITNYLMGKIGIDADSEMLRRYFTTIAKNLEIYDDLSEVRKQTIKTTGLTKDQLNRIITPLEGMYLIADHLRTLIFAITDGALPSNVGGGYNLRMMLRRINGTIDRMNLKLDIDELIDMHIDYLKDTYPELESKRQDVKTILNLESQRYVESKSRMGKMATKLKDKGRAPSVEELITLYESDGITPEYLKEVEVISEIPSSFYAKLSDLHQSDKKKSMEYLSLENIPETDMLFYKDDPMEFEAKVLKIFEKGIVLDRTSFYARGGGQEPDHGTIAGFKVIDVNKHGGVILHELEGGFPSLGDTVSCKVDSIRRANITKNHTSTHILNSSARQVLGSWIWQHSAFKDDDHARLDITHHSSLTDSEVADIEKTANQIIAKDMSVTIENYDRGTAEQKYGFKIYQGGVVPVKSVRIVSIEDFDVEACGGTHVKKTKDIELIKITKTKRIQDGVVRLEFVSGPIAQEYVKQQEIIQTQNKKEFVQKEIKEKTREENKEKTREKIPTFIEKILSEESLESEGINSKGKLCFTADENYDEYFHQNFGKKLVAKDDAAAFCGIFESGPTIRVMIFAGDKSGVNAGKIANEIASILGGSGGGDAKFAQGGGKDTSKKDAAIQKAKSMILG
ncbi:MAG: alanine--tRNA ligase [Candidatus Nitrosopumilus limneticus]|nr:Alanine--tRNA ligase [Candidatus Nitrosopumilus limneticus]MDC4211732.1 alanine--tRNA ligase [Candidatus Nitrosopumilus limneticus]MDC4214560.1 alanine--tRNA ligase [Candidatus Nitrosopumilus limneticus]MDC4215787.1 alanine--tRNA ligase [Candidatus Nitrosopumilus limneticus]MDC4216468.1 alanine--tRNA ligase [Candidatus Nitrosopumilus limneticus]